MIPIPLCPYCNKEIEFNLSIRPVPIGDEYKDSYLHALNSLMLIQAEIMPFGGKTAAKMATKIATKFISKVAALPVTILSCKHCNKIISAELFEASQGAGSTN